MKIGDKIRNVLTDQIGQIVDIRYCDKRKNSIKYYCLEDRRVIYPDEMDERWSLYVSVTKWISYEEFLLNSHDYEEVNLKTGVGLRLLENNIDKWVYGEKGKVPVKHLPLRYLNGLSNNLGDISVYLDGNFHQNCLTGVPVFSDGKVLLLGLQEWDGLINYITSRGTHEKI
jgi:hypothetical protein